MLLWLLSAYLSSPVTETGPGDQNKVRKEEDFQFDPRYVGPLQLNFLISHVDPGLGIIQVWKIMQSFSHNSTIDPESTDTITNHNTHIFTIHYITSHIWVAIKQVWSVDGISSNQMDWRKNSRVVSSFHIRWAFKPRTSGGNYWVSANTTIALLGTESITSPGGLWKLV